jgi:ArsR family transcriptional regulator, arsenate/arsenite/antimonite-responsive transcriptional repressor / arsenate reductase (thioredoxin)
VRAARHAALGDERRLAIVDELIVSDRSPAELTERLGITSNLLAHHLDVLERVGLVTRSHSAGDGRRRYVRISRPAFGLLGSVDVHPAGPMLFLCSHNSARSQLAAALWTARTGQTAGSAGTHPAARVHRGAVAAARRAGISLEGAEPRLLGRIPTGRQVVTVCDRAHEELDPDPSWWHWSIPDPGERGSARVFDEVVQELDARIATVVGHDGRGASR